MAQTETDVAAAKRELRASIRAARSLRSAAAIEAHGLSVREPVLRAYESASLSGRSGLIAYLPMATEPSPLPAMTAAFERGAPVWVPVVLPGKQLGFAPWEPGLRTTTNPTLAIAEPREGVQDASVVLGAALMIVPALAGSESGVRLGQGGGYYDRLFATWDAESSVRGGGAPTRVALLFPDEVLAEGVIPVEPHDARIDAVIA